MKLMKRLGLWLPVLSVGVSMINLSGQDDKNLLLFLTSPLMLWLNPQLTDLHYTMDNELLFQCILYGIHFFFWLGFGLLFDWLLARRRAK